MCRASAVAMRPEQESNAVGVSFSPREIVRYALSMSAARGLAIGLRRLPYRKICLLAAGPALVILLWMEAETVYAQRAGNDQHLAERPAHAARYSPARRSSPAPAKCLHDDAHREHPRVGRRDERGISERLCSRLPREAVKVHKTSSLSPPVLPEPGISGGASPTQDTLTSIGPALEGSQASESAPGRSEGVSGSSSGSEGVSGSSSGSEGASGSSSGSEGASGSSSGSEGASGSSSGSEGASGSSSGSEGASGSSDESSASSGPLAPVRFFSSSSFWNEPVSAGAPLDPTSGEVVGAFDAEVAAEEQAEKGPSINTTKWSVPVYTVPADQPTVRVKLGGASPEPALRSAWSAVPLPSNAQPAAGTDKHLAVWQPSTGRLWEFWRLVHGAEGWYASWGGAMQNVSSNPGVYGPEAWPGAKPWWGVWASSLSIVGGLITLEDLELGQIDHALLMSIPEVRAGVYASPAQRTDGKSTNPLSLPEGAHLRLGTQSQPCGAASSAVDADGRGSGAALWDLCRGQ